MKTLFKALRHGALISAVVWLASPASALEPLNILFVDDHGSYAGNYGWGDKSISVVIDGLRYQGHFSEKTSDADGAALDGTPLSGRWGRAFLFASSAKVIQCTLDAGFPKVSGQCRDADGRPFKLIPASKL